MYDCLSVVYLFSFMNVVRNWKPQSFIASYIKCFYKNLFGNRLMYDRNMCSVHRSMFEFRTHTHTSILATCTVCIKYVQFCTYEMCIHTSSPSLYSVHTNSQFTLESLYSIFFAFFHRIYYNAFSCNNQKTN